LAISAGFVQRVLQIQKDNVILRRGDADYSGIGSKHYKASVEAGTIAPTFNAVL
jgi:hypothetical protein